MTWRAGGAGLAAFTVALAALAAALLAGCGGGTGSAGGEELRVSAAASLRDAFEEYAAATPAEERFSFAGSDQLAAQIRQGAAPDVYAAADMGLAEALSEDGLVGEPVVFAAGELVLAVPAEGSEIDTIGDLARPGVDLVLGTDAVPFGSYARTVLDRLPAAEREAILANVRSEEPDAKAAVGKLAQGAADASFVYASDVAAAGGRLRAIELPAGLRPRVRYGVAVVEGAENPEGAREFVDGLLSGPGTRALEDAGFGAPPALGDAGSRTPPGPPTLEDAGSKPLRGARTLDDPGSGERPGRNASGADGR